MRNAVAVAVAVVVVLVSVGLGSSPAAAAVVSLDDGIEITVDDLVVDNLFLPFDTVARTVTYNLPDEMEAVAAHVDGIPCLFVFGQVISCALPANFGGELSVQMRATAAFFQEDVARTLVGRGGASVERFTVSAGARLDTVASFAAADCAVLGRLAAALDWSVEDVLVASSALLQTAPLSLPLPTPEPGPADCEVAVVLPADQAVPVLGYATLTRQTPGAWVELSGQFIAAVLRALVRG